MNFKKWVSERRKDVRKGQKVYNSFIGAPGVVQAVDSRGNILIKFNGKVSEFSIEELSTSRDSKYDWEIK